jgi:ribonuclease HI
MPWQRMMFRNDAVWVLVGDDGRPVLDRDGRAEMKYRETDTKTYRPGPANLSPATATLPPATTLPSEASGPPRRPNRPKRTAPPSVERQAAVASADPGPAGGTGALPIMVWTDGACSGNPGPMGIGVVITEGSWRQEAGEYLGIGTNNIAELVAIERGLELAALRIESVTRRVRVHSDSSYAIGLLEKGWKAKANQELVARIRKALAAFPAAVTFVKVSGHAGVVENERCDQLARRAVELRRSI